MHDHTLAAVFHGAGQSLELQHVVTPTPQTGEILVRVSCCTLCGSDLHTYAGHRTTPLPTILGHEVVGRIEAWHGSEPPCDYDGAPLQVGDRITWSIAASCGTCFYCDHALPQKCTSLFKYGHAQIKTTETLHGGLAERCLLRPGTALFCLPDTLPDEVAGPVNCATATVASALRHGGGCRDNTVLVMGAGMLGLTACAMARADGARDILVCDIDAHRLALAPAFGATRTCDVSDDDALRQMVKETTDGRGADLAIELSGAVPAVTSCLDQLRIGGHAVLVGTVFPTPPVALFPETLVRRQLTVRGVHNYAPQDLARALAFMESHSQDHPFAGLVERTFPLRDADAAMRYAIDKKPHRVAVTP